MADSYNEMLYDKKGRVIRTAPGTPMAEENRGFGMGRTDPLVWANQFRRNDNQLAALPAVIPPGQTAATAARPAEPISSQVLSEITSNIATGAMNSMSPSGFNAFLSPVRVQPPALTQLAQKGPNHQQDWMAAAAAGRNRVRPWIDQTRPVYTTYGPVAREPQEEPLTAPRGLRWGSAFR